MTIRQVVRRALIASVLITGALAIVLILSGDISDTDARILGSTGLIAIFNLVAIPAGILLDRGRAAGLAWTTISLSGVAFALWELGLWGAYDDSAEAPYRAAAVVTVLALTCSQNAALTADQRDDDAPAVVNADLAARLLGLVAATLFIVAVVIDGFDDGLYRLLGAAAVAAFVASLLTRILRGTGPRADARRASAEGDLHRLRLVFENGAELVLEIRAASFATAAGRAIERAERERSSRVQRLERLSED